MAATALALRGVELRHGFTYGRAEALAWAAVRRHAPTLGLDLSDRFEAAWSAVTEHLYRASEPPTPEELVRAGWDELARLCRTDLYEHGYAVRPGYGRDRLAGSGSAASFRRYWETPRPPTPEDVVVDRMAVRQILPELTGPQAQALLALAVHGDYDRAAEALGMPPKSYESLLRRARAAFFALWHEHETPSRTWRHDKRVHRRVPRRQAASTADAINVLSAIRNAFAGQARIASMDLLARLATADPARFSDWGPHDLADFLRPYRVSRHQVKICGVPKSGYRLEDITAAIEDVTGAVTDELAAA